MRDFINFIKSTGIYLIGNILSKAVAFFMLPLYTKYLPPNAYGTYDLHIAYITFLSSILFFDIWGGIMRFMFDYRDEKDKARPVMNGMVIFAISTLLYTISVIILGNMLHISFLGLLYVYGIVMNLSQVVGYVARAFGQNYIYAIGGLAGTVVNVICNMIFIVGFRQGYECLYVSYNIGMCVNIMIVGSRIHFSKFIKFRFWDQALFREMLVYAAPLSLNSAAYWFLTSYNKVVINQQLTAVENGLYAVAGKFSAMIQLVTQCFQMAWQELTFSKAGAGEEEKTVFYTRAVNEYIKFMGLGTLMIIPMIKMVFPYMIDAAYQEAENIVPFALLGTLFSCIGTFMASILSTIKKNRLLFTTTLQGSMINVILIHILIHSMGVQAASISFAVGYLVVTVRRFMLINKFIKIRIHKKSLAGLTGGFAVVCLIYFRFDRWMNMLELAVLCMIGLYIYREIMKKFVKKVRNR